jgi:hypothetical protein
MFCLEYPLAAHQIYTRWPGHKIPCFILAKGDKLVGNGSVPDRLPESVAMRDGSGEKGTPTGIIPHGPIGELLRTTRVGAEARSHWVTGDRSSNRRGTIGRRPSQGRRGRCGSGGGRRGLGRTRPSRGRRRRRGRHVRCGCMGGLGILPMPMHVDRAGGHVDQASGRDGR